MEMGTNRVSIFSKDPRPLASIFYDRDVLTIARDLLGKLLVRKLEGNLLTGLIVETEAYDGESDQGCHARCGRTRRNEVMYGPAGFAYVYFTYGMHWCMNCVTGRQDYPAAVLIRGILPVAGQREMQINRKRDSMQHIADGPARLCQALRIDGVFNGLDLCDPLNPLFIAEGLTLPDRDVTRGPRVGLNKVPEPWQSLPWRFQVRQPLSMLYNTINTGET